MRVALHERKSEHSCDRRPKRRVPIHLDRFGKSQSRGRVLTGTEQIDRHVLAVGRPVVVKFIDGTTTLRDILRNEGTAG